MPLRTLVVLSLLVLAGSPLAADNAASRGRWGGGVGIRKFHAIATYDYKDSVTPLVRTTGPYTGAVTTIDSDFKGIYFVGGYRGPVRAGNKVGFGIDFLLSGAGPDLPELSVVGTSPNGTRVTFVTDQGGLIDQITIGGAGHVSYTVAPILNIMAGAKVTSFRVKSGSGAYLVPPQSFPAFFQNGDSQVYRVMQAYPWVGAEVLFSNHASVDLSAEFLPTAKKHFADTPWTFDYQRERLALTAALRVFF
jgi:hypothetical protein